MNALRYCLDEGTVISDNIERNVHMHVLTMHSGNCATFLQ